MLKKQLTSGQWFALFMLVTGVGLAQVTYLAYKACKVEIVLENAISVVGSRKYSNDEQQGFGGRCVPVHQP